MATGDVPEVELKLELSPEAAEALAFAELLEGEPKVVEQTSIYFDTAGHALSRAGLSLRIRRTGSSRIQTVKAGGAAAGLFIRPEWEGEVADDTPVLDATTPLAALLGERTAEIAPLFTVENERRSWIQRVSGAEIEVVLDQGRVVAGDRTTLICELELEQKGGYSSALFALARQIDAVTPVHLGVLSKAERGYRLLGPLPVATKAWPIPLTPDMTAAAAFEAIAQACLRQFRLNEPLILDHRDAAGVHEARVALRRLRSTFAACKPMVSDGRSDELSSELRWLAAELGRARDLDVLIGRAGQGPLLKPLGAARERAYAQAETALRSPRARGLMIDLVEWIVAGAWHTGPNGADLRELPVREFASRALDRLRRKVKTGGRDLEQLEDEARHELRKSAKKLRYAAEFFAALYTGKREKRRYKRFLAELEALQDHLGALNDFATAPELLARVGLAGDPAAERLVRHGEKADLLAAAAECHDALIDSKRFWR